MNIRLMKRLDDVLGQLVASVISAPLRIQSPSTVTSLLLIRPGGIGDAVLLAPAIDYLKITFPSAHITVLAEKRNVGIFSLIPGVDKTLCYDYPREFIKALCGCSDLEGSESGPRREKIIS